MSKLSLSLVSHLAITLRFAVACLFSELLLILLWLVCTAVVSHTLGDVVNNSLVGRLAFYPHSYVQASLTPSPLA